MSIIHPDTNEREDAFRERVRSELNLPWDTRDESLFAELRRLRKQDEELKNFRTARINAPYELRMTLAPVAPNEVDPRD